MVMGGLTLSTSVSWRSIGQVSMRYFFSLFLVATLYTMPLSAEAAVVMVESEFTNLNASDVFTVDVVADTEQKLVNTVAVDIVYPEELLELVAIDDGNSILSLWVEAPHDAGGLVHFSGMTPGGFVTSHAPLLSLTFRAKESGQGNIEASKTEFLLHDGLGTVVPSASRNIHVSVGSGVSTIQTEMVDVEPPENFAPEIISDPDLYGGDATLIFATKDKGSGLSHFVVREGSFGRFDTAESPYRLRNQALDEVITVKAIDTVGNERVVTVYPQNWSPWYERSRLFIGILIVCALSLCIFGWLLWRFFFSRR